MTSATWQYSMITWDVSIINSWRLIFKTEQSIVHQSNKDQSNMRTIYTPDLRQSDFGLEPPSEAGIQQETQHTNIAIKQDS